MPHADTFDLIQCAMGPFVTGWGATGLCALEDQSRLGFLKVAKPSYLREQRECSMTRKMGLAFMAAVLPNTSPVMAARTRTVHGAATRVPLGASLFQSKT